MPGLERPVRLWKPGPLNSTPTPTTRECLRGPPWMRSVNMALKKSIPCGTCMLASIITLAVATRSTF